MRLFSAVMCYLCIGKYITKVTVEEFIWSDIYFLLHRDVRQWVRFSIKLNSRNRSVDVNDWVAADYDDNWYIGQVQQIDEEHGEIEVSFMTKGKGKAATNSFKWPAQKDVLWVTKQSILCVIEPPLPACKTGRTFKVTEATMELINQRHKSYKL